LTAFERFDRQVRLKEVGAAGQARIRAARLRVAPDARIERLYLERAGVESLQSGPEVAPGDFPHASAFHHPAAAAVGAECHRALRALRALLELSQ
jgi:hypothetical protein